MKIDKEKKNPEDPKNGGGESLEVVNIVLCVY